MVTAILLFNFLEKEWLFSSYALPFNLLPFILDLLKHNRIKKYNNISSLNEENPPADL